VYYFEVHYYDDWSFLDPAIDVPVCQGVLAGNRKVWAVAGCCCFSPSGPLSWACLLLAVLEGCGLLANGQILQLIYWGSVADWGTLFVRGPVWLIVPFEGRDLSLLEWEIGLEACENVGQGTSACSRVKAISGWYLGCSCGSLLLKM